MNTLLISPKTIALTLAFLVLAMVTPAFASHSEYHYEVTRGTLDSSMPAPQGGNSNIDEHGFRFFCVPSHFSYDDPVVYPGELGRAHLHMFYGNLGITHESTSESIVNTGRTSCDGGTTNRSGYWVPALFNEAGDVVLPQAINLYYKSWVSDRSQLQPIPQGLQILANSDILNSMGTVVARPGHPEDTWSSNIRVTDHEGLTVEIMFPDCIAVDGNGDPVLTSPGGTSHVAYSSGSCPASHPYNIPQLTQIIIWDNVPYESDWYFASDMSSSASKGTTVHADYVAGWTEAAAQIMADCVRDGYKECGPGLHAQWEDTFFAPNGDQVYDFFQLAAGVDSTPNAMAGWPVMLSGDMQTPTPTPTPTPEPTPTPSGGGGGGGGGSSSSSSDDSDEEDETDVVKDTGSDTSDKTTDAGVDKKSVTTPVVVKENRVRSTSNLNVRSTPGGVLVKQVPMGSVGTQLTSNAISKDGYFWHKVRFDNGVEGYVASEFTQPVAPVVSNEKDALIRAQIEELQKQIIVLMTLLAEMLAKQ